MLNEKVDEEENVPIAEEFVINTPIKSQAKLTACYFCGFLLFVIFTIISLIHGMNLTKKDCVITYDPCEPGFNATSPTSQFCLYSLNPQVNYKRVRHDICPYEYNGLLITLLGGTLFGTVAALFFIKAHKS